MLSVLKEILVSFTELAADPEPPLRPYLWASKQQRPAATAADSDGVLVFCPSERYSTTPHMRHTGRRDVGVTTAKDERNEPPRMIVVVSLIVRRAPVMKTKREPTKVEHPPSQIWALFTA